MQARRAMPRQITTHLLLALDEGLDDAGVALLHGDDEGGGQRRVGEVDVAVGDSSACTTGRWFSCAAMNRGVTPWHLASTEAFRFSSICTMLSWPSCEAEYLRMNE